MRAGMTLGIFVLCGCVTGEVRWGEGVWLGTGQASMVIDVYGDFPFFYI
jgi:hypothetical protein